MTEQHENAGLPPKTSTVDRLVTMQGDIDKVLAGKKSASRRNGRHADVGEIMTLGGKKFVIDNVYMQSLGELTDEHARSEGFADVEDYKQFILSMHPGMPWVPQMKVCVHEFSLVQE